MQMVIQLVIVKEHTFGIHQFQCVRNHRYQIAPVIMIVLQSLHANRMHSEF